MEAATALHNLGAAVDVNHLLNQFALALKFDPQFLRRDDGRCFFALGQNWFGNLRFLFWWHS